MLTKESRNKHCPDRSLGLGWLGITFRLYAFTFLGVVADRDSEQFDGQTSRVSPTGAYPHTQLPHHNNPDDLMPIKRRPESLAVRGHEYEELPTSRYVCSPRAVIKEYVLK